MTQRAPPGGKTLPYSFTMLPYLLDNQTASRQSKQLHRSLQVYIIFLNVRKRTDSAGKESFYTDVVHVAADTTRMECADIGGVDFPTRTTAAAVCSNNMEEIRGKSICDASTSLCRRIALSLIKDTEVYENECGATFEKEFPFARLEAL